MTTKETMTTTAPEPSPDPLAIAADRVTAAEAALEEASTSLAHWRDIAARRTDDHRALIGSGDDAAIEEASQAVGNAERTATAVAASIPSLENELDEARAEYARANARAVADRMLSDKDLTGEHEYEVVTRLSEVVSQARYEAWRDLSAIRNRQAEACAEAIAAGLPTTPDGYVGPLPLLPLTTRGRAIMAWPAAQTVVLPGQVFHERPASPDDIIDAILSGKPKAVQVAEVAPSGDDVSAEDADDARRLLAFLYSHPVRPMPDYDALDLDPGVWAAVSEFHRDGERVYVAATVVTRGVGRLYAISDPRRFGEVIAEQIVTPGQDNGAGVRVEVDLIDPSAHNGPVDVSAVQSAAIAAIQAIDPEAFGEPLAHLLGEGFFYITGIAKAGTDDNTVVIRWFRLRDSWEMADALAQSLPLNLVRDSLVGLGVPGAGVIRDVRHGDDWSHVIDLNSRVLSDAN